MLLTEPQFYLRVLEEIIMSNGLPCCDTLMESTDLREFLEAKFALKNEEEDDGKSMHQAMERVGLTIQGFIQAMGRKVGIDLKFIPQD